MAETRDCEGVGRRGRRGSGRLPLQALEHISWDHWFAKFHDSGLAFLYQDRRASGEDRTFVKLVNRQGM
jgi:hypothetical protein